MGAIGGLTGGLPGGSGGMPALGSTPSLGNTPIGSLTSGTPLSGLTGNAGGAGGTGFAGPGVAGTMQPVNAQQLGDAYNSVQSGMGNQAALLSALQGQGGLANQSQVYGQLQGIVNGTGPNPAQAQLAQATGANVANQAALMAGQRGAAGNVGLMARQAAQQGAATQQGAAGQAATLQAQQSLNALGQAGTMANTQAANQIGQTNANVAAQQAEQGQLLNAAGAYNTSQVGMQSNINNVNGQLANTTLQGQQALIGGVMQGIGGGLSSMFSSGGQVQRFDDGGDVDQTAGPSLGNYSLPNAPSSEALAGLPSQSVPSSDDLKQPDMGSELNRPAPPANLGVDTNLNMGQISGPQSDFGKFLNGVSGGVAANTQTPTFGSDAGAAALAAGASSMTSGGQSGKSGGGGGGGGLMGLMALMAKGGNVGSKLKGGGHVPGQAKVSGNSYKNDTVKALLSPGEVVVPRSVMQSANPVDGAAKFVAAVLAKKKGKK